MKVRKAKKGVIAKPAAAKKTARKRAKPTAAETKESDDRDEDAKPTAKKRRVEKTKKEKKLKAEKEKKSRDKNDKLVPRPNIKQYDKDPTFELKEEIPFVSVSAYSKLAIRAVLTKNEAFLKRLIDDKAHCASILFDRSKFVRKNALSYAIDNEDIKMVDLIWKGIEKISKECGKRVHVEKNLLELMGTPNYELFISSLLSNVLMIFDRFNNQKTAFLVKFRFEISFGIRF